MNKLPPGQIPEIVLLLIKLLIKAASLLFSSLTGAVYHSPLKLAAITLSSHQIHHCWNARSIVISSFLVNISLLNNSLIFTLATGLPYFLEYPLQYIIAMKINNKLTFTATPDFYKHIRS